MNKNFLFLPPSTYKKKLNTTQNYWNLKLFHWGKQTLFWLLEMGLGITSDSDRSVKQEVRVEAIFTQFRSQEQYWSNSLISSVFTLKSNKIRYNHSDFNNIKFQPPVQCMTNSICKLGQISRNQICTLTPALSVYVIGWSFPIQLTAN